MYVQSYESRDASRLTLDCIYYNLLMTSSNDYSRSPFLVGD